MRTVILLKNGNSDAWADCHPHVELPHRISIRGGPNMHDEYKEAHSYRIDDVKKVVWET